MKLRPYQEQFVSNTLEQFASGVRRTLGVMATGCGKTVCFSHTIDRFLQGRPNKRALILAHREELIFQAQEKYRAVTGLTPEIEMGEYRASRTGRFSDCPVVVSSVQTQNAGRPCPRCEAKKKRRQAAAAGVAAEHDGWGQGLLWEPATPAAAVLDEPCDECLEGMVRRMQRFDPNDFDLLVIDEAHHATATTYRRIINYYSRNPDLCVLGTTATPDRQDEAALGRIFESVSFEYNVVDAINDGYLVPIEQQWIVCEDLDFSKVRTTAGDLNNGDLEAILLEEEALHQVTSPTIDIAGDRATIVFAASVQHAELMADIFNRHKPNSAICIHGGTPKEERRLLLQRYAAGEYQYLCGCGVFLEGFDEPRIEIVAMARPTKSRALYSQAVGRGTRPIIPPTQATAAERKAAIAASAKPSVLVLDFVGNSGKHKLVSTADILGGNYEDDVVAAAVASAKKKGGKANMQEELQAAQEERARKLREMRKRKDIKATATYTRQKVDPFDVFDITPAREPGWHKGRKPTERMVETLDKLGIKSKDLSFSQAKQLIQEAINRREHGLCTFKQAKLLAQYGEPTNLSFKEASARLDAIAKNGWRPINTTPVTAAEAAGKEF